MKVPSQSELMHHRLQAWIRENNSQDLQYLGFYPDSFGVFHYWYRIGKKHVVTVEQIEDIELISEPDDDEEPNIFIGDNI